MTFNEITNRLDKYIKFINKAIVATAIAEAILVISIGVLSSNVNTENSSINKICLILLIVFGLAYLLLLFAKTIYNKSYPGSITSELKAERELAILKADANRQKIINDFLVDVIQRLNGQTCALNYGDDTHLCDAGIREGIYNLLQPVLENVAFILGTVNTQFTIGVYLNDYRTLSVEDSWDNGIIIINDNLNKQSLITKSLLEQIDVKNEQLDIQTGIRHSFNNAVFFKHDYMSEGEYTIICSPIPLACNENETNGVLFIISKKLANIPVDTDVNLTIFNSVVANWVYRYNECIGKRQQQ